MESGQQSALQFKCSSVYDDEKDAEVEPESYSFQEMEDWAVDEIWYKIKYWNDDNDITDGDGNLYYLAFDWSEIAKHIKLKKCEQSP